MAKGSVTAQKTTALNNNTDFSQRSPAYKPPRPQPPVAPVMSNANIDLKLKLFKEQLLEEFVLMLNNLVIDGGDLDA